MLFCLVDSFGFLAFWEGVFLFFIYIYICVYEVIGLIHVFLAAAESCSLSGPPPSPWCLLYNGILHCVLIFDMIASTE